ncbi:AMP-binding protein [Microvirgula aerodenitrificans]|uniref:AMP-binding protein n=1 Tax=Microvirgula aerodenitrificans TaxID=57480 RepID=UPI00248D5440|nr:AMP-binding protein [Microvirgula aerodenitrificans]
MPERLTLDTLLTRGRAADSTVAWRDGARLDYAALLRGCTDWHAAFAAEPGPTVALYFNDSFDFACALLGAWHAGKTVVLPADAQPGTLARLRNEVDRFAGDLPADCLPLPPLSGAATPDWQPLDPDFSALVIHTSGSTGVPAAIGKCLRQMMAEVGTLAACWDGLLGEAPVFATVSHQHIYGLLFRILWPLTSGRPFIATRHAYPEDIVAALAGQPAVLVASPAHLKRLPSGLDWATATRGLRAVFSSGGPLPDDAVPVCRELLGRAPIEVYGSSETGGIAWRQRERDDATGWLPFPAVTLRYEDTLWVRSPNLPDDDWFRSADHARPHGDGFLLLGRQDRIVKIEEKRVSLTAMEQRLLASGLLDEVRVLPLDGARQRLGVAAVPSAAGRAALVADGRGAFGRRLRQWLARDVEASVLPRHWRYGWALPADSQGKITQAALTRWFDPRRPDVCLLAREAQSVRLWLRAGAGLPYFDGHFPGRPILPGIAQIEWAIRFGCELFPLPATVQRLEVLKFQQVIVPDSVLTLTLDFDAARGSLTFAFDSDAGRHAGGRILFGETA